MESYKYLAIKNWERFQGMEDGRPAPWLRDYTDQDHDPLICQLTMFQRAVLQLCRRLRARFGRNLPVPCQCVVREGSDTGQTQVREWSVEVQWVCSAGSVLPQERKNVPKAMALLINRGFLIPSNEQLSLIEESREEESRVREEVKESKIGRTVTPKPAMQAGNKGKTKTNGKTNPSPAPDVATDFVPRTFLKEE